MEFTKTHHILSRFANAALKNSWTRSALAATMLVCFLLIFQPFDYNLLALPVKLKIVAMVGMGTFMLCVVHQWLSGATERFIRITLICETLLWLAVIILFSQLLFAYTIQAGMNVFSWAGSLQYVYASAFISFIPMLALIGINRLPKPSTQNSKADTVQSTIPIGDERIALNDLFLLKAEDNYIRVYSKNAPPRLIRGSISKAANRINGHTWLMRIHRSYLINLRFIESIQGNSKSLKVKLTGFDTPIPVARSKSKEFRRMIRTQNGTLSAT